MSASGARSFWDWAFRVTLFVVVASLGLHRPSEALGEDGQPSDGLIVVTLLVHPTVVRSGDVVQVDALVRSSADRELRQDFGVSYGGGEVDVLWMIPDDTVVVPPGGLVHVSAGVRITEASPGMEVGVSAVGDVVLFPNISALRVEGESAGWGSWRGSLAVAGSCFLGFAGFLAIRRYRARGSSGCQSG